MFLAFLRFNPALWTMPNPTLGRQLIINQLTRRASVVCQMNVRIHQTCLSGTFR